MSTIGKQRIVLFIDKEEGAVHLKAVPNPPLPLYEKDLERFAIQAESLLKELSSRALEPAMIHSLKYSIEALVRQIHEGVIEYAVAETRFEFARLQDIDQPLRIPALPTPIHPAIRPAARVSAPPVSPMPPEASSEMRRREIKDISPSPAYPSKKKLMAVLCCDDYDFVAYASFEVNFSAPEAMLFGERVFLRKGRVVWDLVKNQKATADRLVTGKEEEFETKRLYMEVTVQVVADSGAEEND